MKQVSKLNVEHSIRITPKLLHALQILQMDACALENYVAGQFEENPVLEYAAPTQERREYWNLPQRDTEGAADWQQAIPDERSAFGTLEFFLTDQLDRMELSDEMRQWCTLLVMLLDDQGYLRMEQVADLADAPRFSEALAVVQSLDPPGIGARDLSECLLLQLRRRGWGDHLSAWLAEHCLQELARHNYPKIARMCGRSRREIEDAAAEIRMLDPRPGSGFAGGERTGCIRPDFYISVADGQIVMERNGFSFPQVGISRYYERLYRTTDDEQVQHYLREKIAAARTLMSSLDHRVSTVERCLRVILRVQREFFLTAGRPLRPLLMEDVAAELDVQISTVSRAISGKYLEFDGKTYSFKDFFARSAAGDFQEQMSVAQIKALIAQIVANEDPGAPMSDQKIVELLRKGGSELSRRTVAKYREELRIPSSRQRRRI